MFSSAQLCKLPPQCWYSEKFAKLRGKEHPGGLTVSADSVKMNFFVCLLANCYFTRNLLNVTFVALLLFICIK